MINRTIYIASFILFILMFLSCQDISNEPETINSDTNILHRDRSGIVDVLGKVYKDSNPVNEATVMLYKGEDYLDQDITDSGGNYLINICSLHQGAGWYSVEATKDFKGQKWYGSEDFYWDNSDTVFVIDLYLIHWDQK